MNLRHLAHLKLQSLLDILSNQKVVYLEMEEKKKYIPKRFLIPQGSFSFSSFFSTWKLLCNPFFTITLFLSCEILSWDVYLIHKLIWQWLNLTMLSLPEKIFITVSYANDSSQSWYQIAFALHLWLSNACAGLPLNRKSSQGNEGDNTSFITVWENNRNHFGYGNVSRSTWVYFTLY